MRGFEKYQKDPALGLKDRQWPDRTIEKAPAWVSLDLAESAPMAGRPLEIHEKAELLRLLIRLGFREISVSGERTDPQAAEFLRAVLESRILPGSVRLMIDAGSVPADIQSALAMARGVSGVLLQIKGLALEEEAGKTLDLAREAAALAASFPGEVSLQYTVRDFAHADLEVLLGTCGALADLWQASPARPLTLCLATDVMRSSLNVYADRVEYVDRNLPGRDRFVLSVRPHSCRGTGNAAAEMALLAGAQKVEGTLFGYGDSSGQTSILTLAMNLFSEGMDPGLSLEDARELAETCERIGVPGPEGRHPYFGKESFAAYSPSRREAVEKALEERRDKEEIWRVPYLQIDPSDIGSTFLPAAGALRGGSAARLTEILAARYGFKLPMGMQEEFAGEASDLYPGRRSLTPEEVLEAFRASYIRNSEPMHFRRLQVTDVSGDLETEFDTRIRVSYSSGGEFHTFQAAGNGPLDALQRGLAEHPGIRVRILDYEEHALNEGSDSQAAAYVRLLDPATGRTTYGAGVSSNITRASVRAVFSGLNRLGLSAEPRPARK